MATKIAKYHSNHRPSSDTQALMVKIDWTDAKVVKIQARKRLTLDASTVSIIRGQYTVIARQQMPVGEGMTIHFVASDEFKGWYYICLQQHDGTFACTCPRASKFHLDCHHQKDAASFEARRTQPSEPLPDEDLQAFKLRREHEFRNRHMTGAEANDYFMRLAREEDARRAAVA